MELAGRTLGRYQVLEMVGCGGMGEVYKAYDPTLERYVAIKVLLPHLARDEEFVQRFLREARVAAQLRHPGIVTIYEVGQEGNLYYFAMEYFPGPPLSEIIAREGPLAVERALSILEQVAAALDYAHQRGLVHRDVKPGNIIVDAEGRAVLTDFGIVRAAEGTRLTASGQTLGTPEYMAPEQARGEEQTAVTDIYSLGVVAYEMLAGEVPFRATTPFAVMMKHVSEPPPPLREKNPRLPEGVEQVVLWALAKEPSQRPQSGAEFVAELRAAAEGRGWKRPLLAPRRVAEEKIYRRLRRALAASRWEEAISLAKEIPGYRDADLLREQAQQHLAEERRQAQVYRKLQEALAASRWEEAISLAASIPGYRDADLLGQRAREAAAEEQQREEIYRQLEEAMAASRWEEAIALAESIPGYRDADRRREQAREALEEEKRAVTYDRFQEAIAKHDWRLALELAKIIPVDYRDVRLLREGVLSKYQWWLKVQEAAAAVQQALQNPVPFQAQEALRHLQELAPDEPETAALARQVEEALYAYRVEVDRLHEQALIAEEARDWETVLVALQRLQALQADVPDLETRLEQASREVEATELLSAAEASIQRRKWQEAIEKAQRAMTLSEGRCGEATALIRQAEAGLEIEQRHRRIFLVGGAAVIGLAVFVIAGLLVWGSFAGGGPFGAVFWTPTPMATVTPTATPRPASTSTPTPTATFTPVPTDTPTATPTPEPTRTPTRTPAPTRTPVPTETPTPEPTATPTRTPTKRPRPTSTPTWTPYPFCALSCATRSP